LTLNVVSGKVGGPGWEAWGRDAVHDTIRHLLTVLADHHAQGVLVDCYGFETDPAAEGWGDLEAAVAAWAAAGYPGTGREEEWEDGDTPPEGFEP